MNNSLIITPTKNMSREEWLAFRHNGLGSSDISAVLGFSEYKEPVEVFYDKISLNAPIDFNNISKFMGLQHEEKISELRQYYGANSDSMIKNFNEGKKTCQCRRVNAYIQNKKYPWLFVSPDRRIKIFGGKTGISEFKTMAGWESKKWIAKVPLGYTLQVTDQMLVMEESYAELFTMTDGRLFELIPFDKRPDLEEMVIDQTHDFWYQRIIPGRKLITQKYEAIRTHNMKLANECQARIEELEPAPTGNERYKEFLNEKYQKPLAEVGVIKGNADDLSTAYNLRRIKQEIKVLEENAWEQENRLKRRIADGAKLDFANEGYVSWSGNPRTFRMSLK